jgi:hypothetical protein
MSRNVGQLRAENLTVALSSRVQDMPEDQVLAHLNLASPKRWEEATEGELVKAGYVAVALKWLDNDACKMTAAPDLRDFPDISAYKREMKRFFAIEGSAEEGTEG